MSHHRAIRDWTGCGCCAWSAYVLACISPASHTRTLVLPIGMRMARTAYVLATSRQVHEWFNSNGR